MGIDIDYADYKTINRHNGYTIGFNSDVVLVNDLEVELLKKFKNYLEKAKGILVTYSIKEDKNLFDISAIMEKLSDITNSDSEIIFGTEIDNNLKINECRFHIYITGLESI